MKAILLLALAVLTLSFVVGCKAPDEMTKKNNDSTSKMEKQAGGD